MENAASVVGLVSAESSDPTSNMKDVEAKVNDFSTHLNISKSERSEEISSTQSSLLSPSSPSKLEV
jgi:hypothetical protein